MASSTIDFRIAAASSRKSRARIVVRVAIVAAAAAIAAALALLPNPANAAVNPIVVKMTDKPPVYTPKEVVIKPGDTVKWVNDGQEIHAVSTNAAIAQNPKDTSIPKGAVAFDSGFIPPGGEYSQTFTVPGKYRYFCLPHEKDGMVGVVVVKK
ncbi:MAG: plastocyanin/azurin family copper-binding protein [Candidatus Binatus sp.]